MAGESMVEKVARAIVVAQGGNPDYIAKFHDGSTMQRWRAAEDLARAAIEAMRQPTLAMCRAYYEASAAAAREDFGVDPGPFENLDADQVARLLSFGRAMIDAALSEGQDPAGRSALSEGR